MVAILVTGERLVGKGIRAIEPVIEELILGARREVHIASYRFGPGAEGILRSLETALESGVRVILVVNRFGEQPPGIRDWLTGLSARFGHVKVAEFASSQGQVLHAKVVVVDRSKAVISSANLTWGGLVGNHEIGVLVDGEPAWQVASFIDRLTESSET